MISYLLLLLSFSVIIKNELELVLLVPGSNSQEGTLNSVVLQFDPLSF
jgi:hypothetical protein